MSLKLIIPAKSEPVSVEEARAYLRVDAHVDDKLIQTLISSARTTIEAYTNRCFIEQTWQFKLNAGFASARSNDFYLSSDIHKTNDGIELPKSPFVKLESNPIYFDGTSHHEIKDYKLDTHGQVSKIHFSHAYLNSKGNVQINFTAGYAESSEGVPAPLKQAILMLIASAYENRTGANNSSTQPVFMNEAVLQIVTPYRIHRLG